MNEEILTLSVPEAGKLLGCSRGYSYLLARQGRLPVVRVGERKLRVPRAALQRLLETGTAKGEEVKER